MQQTIVAPGLVLILWTLFMLIWMTAARMNAPGEKVDMAKVPPGVRGVDFEDKMPAATNWKAHNHTHLYEQPTLFYAVLAFAAIAGSVGAADIWLAWAYVILRILHSLWQGFVNTIPVRFMLFLLATLCLATLTIRTLMVAL